MTAGNAVSAAMTDVPSSSNTEELPPPVPLIRAMGLAGDLVPTVKTSLNNALYEEIAYMHMTGRGG